MATTEEASDDVDVGHASSAPSRPPTSQAPRGSTVTLVLSSGAEDGERAQRDAGSTAPTAEQTLADRGFTREGGQPRDDRLRRGHRDRAGPGRRHQAPRGQRRHPHRGGRAEQRHGARA